MLAAVPGTPIVSRTRPNPDPAVQPPPPAPPRASQHLPAKWCNPQREQKGGHFTPPPDLVPQQSLMGSSRPPSPFLPSASNLGLSAPLIYGMPAAHGASPAKRAISAGRCFPLAARAVAGGTGHVPPRHPSRSPSWGGQGRGGLQAGLRTCTPRPLIGTPASNHSISTRLGKDRRPGGWGWATHKTQNKPIGHQNQHVAWAARP